MGASESQSSEKQMLKKTVVLTVVASLTLLVVACKNDGESVCEHLNDICKQNQNCEEAGKKYDADYDKLTDAQKDAADDYVDCVDDADTCDQVSPCLQKYITALGGTGSVSTSSSGGSSSGGAVTKCSSTVRPPSKSTPMLRPRANTSATAAMVNSVVRANAT